MCVYEWDAVLCAVSFMKSFGGDHSEEKIFFFLSTIFIFCVRSNFFFCFTFLSSCCSLRGGVYKYTNHTIIGIFLRIFPLLLFSFMLFFGCQKKI